MRDHKNNFQFVFCCIILSLAGGYALGQAPAIEWRHSLGGLGIDLATSVVPTPDGGCVAAGFTESSDGDVTGYHGKRDMWVVKFDGAGTVQWKQCLGNDGTEEAYSIGLTNDRGYIVAGYQEINDSSATEPMNYYIIKLNDTGGVQWLKSYGGTWADEVFSIQQTTDGGYIVAGISESYDGDVVCGIWDSLALYRKPWILKLNAAGNIQWQVCINDKTVSDLVNCIRQTTDGGYILSGGFDSSSIIKLTPSGGIEWKRNYQVLGDLRQTSDGGFILVGGNVAMKLDDMGGMVWQKSIGNSFDRAISVWITTDSGYIVAGQTDDPALADFHGDGDVWAEKLKQDGTVQWQKCMGGSSNDYGNSVCQVADGGYVVAGGTESNDGDVMGFHGSDDFWVVKLASQVSISQVSSAPEVATFPNPITDNIEVSGLNAGKAVIYDVTGRIVAERPMANVISFTEMPSGLYILKLYDDLGRLAYFGKVVKI